MSVGRRIGAGAAATVLALGAYVTADVYDLVPGLLTRQSPAPSTLVPSGSPSLIALPTPSAAATTSPSGPSSATPTSPSGQTTPTGQGTSLAPTRAGLTRDLADALADPRLGPTVSVSVRDGVSGAELYARHAERPGPVASTQKLLSALAVTSSLPANGTMTTRTVRGATPGEVVLVAGGDTMLAPGASRPGAVEGRAGLADLAAETARSLTEQGVGPVTLRLDLTYAAGPRYPRGWDLADVRAGYTQGVAQIGLAGQRPEPGHPSPERPERVVAQRLAALLTARGHATTLAPEQTWATPAPEGAAELGAVSSAAYADVLALALDDSDNALTEGLVRQAMAHEGVPTAAEGAPAAFVRDRLVAHDIPVDGLRLVDTSGLARGQQVAAETISEVLAHAVRDDPRGLRRVVADLPVAGLTGTLAERFDTAGSTQAAGIPRAKTGTLTGISSLAGVTTSADGHPLTFVIVADAVPASVGTLAARAALDRFVATLTACGCR